MFKMNLQDSTDSPLITKAYYDGYSDMWPEAELLAFDCSKFHNGGSTPVFAAVLISGIST